MAQVRLRWQRWTESKTFTFAVERTVHFILVFILFIFTFLGILEVIHHRVDVLHMRIVWVSHHRINFCRSIYVKANRFVKETRRLIRLLVIKVLGAIKVFAANLLLLQLLLSILLDVREVCILIVRGVIAKIRRRLRENWRRWSFHFARMS